MARSYPNTTDFSKNTTITPTVAMSLVFHCKNPSVNDFWTYLRQDAFGYSVTGDTAGSNRVVFNRGWSTTVGAWYCDGATHGMTMANYNHFAWTYDGASTANDPLFYANGVSKAVTRQTAPAGTINTVQSNLWLGRWEVASRQIGGSLGYVTVHNVVLTAQEVLDSMNYGVCPRGRVGSWLTMGSPSAGPDVDSSGNGKDMTITNTTVTADPTGIMMPRAPVRMMQAASRSATR